MSFEENGAADLAYKYVTETAENIFLTGKAGTGKTTFLRRLVQHSPKSVVVAAPTGVAALNAGGVTLHSLFQLPFSPFIPTRAGKDDLLSKIRFSKTRLDVIRSLELLVIDEVSMVRADLLDAVDTILKSVRKNYNAPFGGVQMLFIGDLYQLPPVVKDDERPMLSNYYPSEFFFDSLVLRDDPPLLIELTKVYRQKDQAFLDLLNRVRNNVLEKEDVLALDARFDPGFVRKAGEKLITLTSHNKQAELINVAELARLTGREKIYSAEIEGDFGEHLFPADAELKLKPGAQVMFLKNDLMKRFFNGKLGVVESLGEESIRVRCDDGIVDVSPMEWSNTRYALNEKAGKIDQQILGTFTQLPVRAAWAISIHKSQGLTFERMLLDAAAAFAAGQVYVALSRCVSLDGITLLSRIPASAIQSNKEVAKAETRLGASSAMPQRFEKARSIFSLQLLEQLFSFDDAIKQADDLQAAIIKHKAAFNADAEEIAAALAAAVADLNRFAEKFLMQLENLLNNEPLIENNVAAAERIKAARGYFASPVQELITKLSASPFETERRDAADAVNPVLNGLFKSLSAKSFLLAFNEERFSVTGFLQHRANIPRPNVKLNCYAADSAAPVSGDNNGLVTKLRAWRDDVCRTTGLPVFRVASQKSLDELAAKMPATEDELLQMQGFGKAKVRDWGEEILAIINEWCEENNIDRSERQIETKHKERVRDPLLKNGTAAESFRLFKNGLSIDEIAAQRNLVRGTVESHLSVFAASGELDVIALLGKEKYESIAKEINSENKQTLTELKSALPPEIGFGEIRLVTAAENYLRQAQAV